MKGINVTLTEKAHTNLKKLTSATKKNQHEVMSFILEHINIGDMAGSMTSGECR